MPNEQGGGEKREKEEWEVLYKKWRDVFLNFKNNFEQIATLTEKNEDPELSQVWRVCFDPGKDDREAINRCVEWSEPENMKLFLNRIMIGEGKPNNFDGASMSDLTKERLLYFGANINWRQFQMMFRAEAILASYYQNSNNQGVAKVKEIVGQTTLKLRNFFAELDAIPEDEIVLLKPLSQQNAIKERRLAVGRNDLESEQLLKELACSVGFAKAKEFGEPVLSDVVVWGLRRTDGTIIHEGKGAAQFLTR